VNKPKARTLRMNWGTAWVVRSKLHGKDAVGWGASLETAYATWKRRIDAIEMEALINCYTDFRNFYP
jgi:hypothetical protein